MDKLQPLSGHNALHVGHQLKILWESPRLLCLPLGKKGRRSRELVTVLGLQEGMHIVDDSLYSVSVCNY